MRETSLRPTFDDFDESLRTYIYLNSKIASGQRVIQHPWQKRELLEAIVLRLVTLWEVFVEDVIVGCLSWDCSRYAQFHGVVLREDLSADECRTMLTGGGYLDFQDVRHVQQIAQQILVVNPFTAIAEASSRKIDELIVIRDYICHYSGRAERALAEVYRNTYHMQRFREPGSFLWGDARRGGQTRMGAYLDALRDAAAAMRAALDSLAQ
jgi:hypothetical protein